jgi:co-chaperonin GroES (HSP10)
MMRFFRHSQANMHLFRCLLTVIAVFAPAVLVIVGPAYVRGQDKPASNSSAAQVAKAVGTIKTIQPDSITVAGESGGEITAKLSASTKILRVPPGEKDLKNATTLQQQDLQTGDRVLVRGQAVSGDEHTIMALSVIVMKQSDVTAKHQHDLEDWQKRGVDGVVTAVDAATGVISISPGRIGPNKSITIHIAKTTILRRYAPGSVQFDDAKPAPVDQIKVGDQLRALGTRSSDGSEVAAEEVVSGSFRNIAGTIKAIDAASNTMTVQDAISKSSVTVKVAPDSQLQKLPTEMAQRIAMRLKSSAAGATSGDRPGSAVQGQSSQGQSGGSTQSASSSPSGSHNQAGPGGNGPPDLQRMLSRVPAIKLADLQKGDAVVILATSGGNSDAVTTIKLLAGVEAILTASPNQGASSLLSPWSLGAGGEGEAAQ